MDVVRRAEALQDGAAVASVRPTALQALVTQVLAPLDARAATAGLRLYRDTDSRSDVLALSDDQSLRIVLLHLVLRALAREPAPGHIRLVTTFSPGAARIAILSRAPDPPDRASAAEDVGLWAAERVLLSMDGALEREPRRAGYLPLCIVLPACSPLACAA